MSRHRTVKGARQVPASPQSVGRPTVSSYEVSLATTDLEHVEGATLPPLAKVLSPEDSRTSGVREAVVLRTCQRTELYLWAPEGVDVARLPSPFPKWLASARPRTGFEATRHLFRVAAGLESVAVGEAEVRDQVATAASGVWSLTPRPVLAPLFLAAVEAARREAPSVSPARSMAALAAARVVAESGHAFPRVLVIGSGVVGRELTERLAPFARVTIAYHSRPPEESFLRDHGARAVGFESLREELALSEVVLTATKSAGRILGPEDLAVRRDPLLAIDLGVPRNIDPAVGRWPAVRLIDVSGLRSITPPPIDPGFVERIEEHARREQTRLEGEAFEATLDDLRRQLEGVRADLMSSTHPDLRGLTPEQREAVDRITRQLVRRLFDAPAGRLRTMSDAADRDRMRSWAIELLSPRPSSRA